MGSGYEMGGSLDIDVVTPEIEKYFEQITSVTDLDELKEKFGFETYPNFILDSERREIEMEWDTADPEEQIECLKIILEFVSKQGAVVEGMLNWEESCDSENFGRYVITNNKIMEETPEIIWTHATPKTI